jgi:polyhydroxyalkanoate synthesis regulator phasin
MFDQQKVAQDVFNMTKGFWLTTMQMVSTFQDQNERMWHTLLDQGLVMQQESKKMLQESLTRAKQTREQFTETMEENWKKVESSLTGTAKSGK